MINGYDGKFGDGKQPYNELGDGKKGNKTANFIKILPVILDYCQNKNFALDVGCGNGRHSIILSKHFDNIISIDKNDAFCEKFKDQKIKFRLKTFENYKTKVKFDLILFWASFYLMGNYTNALEKARKMLNSKGLIVISDDLTRRSDRAKNINKKVNYNLGESIKKSKLIEIVEIIDEYRITLIGTE